MTTPVNFTDLHAGDRARITGFGLCDLHYRHKLLAMGLTRGTEFLVVRRAPLGDPVQIQVRDFSLCLRRMEAQGLDLERVE